MKAIARFLCVLLVSSCANPARERLEKTSVLTYDSTTGRLAEVTHDANGNGRIDTWVEMDGSLPVRSRLDRDEDGRIERWEYYDGQGRISKVGYSRGNDGTLDAWAYAGMSGRVERIELSSSADENKIDRWERYDATGLEAADEDTDGDGIADKWETYEGGSLNTAAFDETHDGRPDRRLNYSGGVLASIDSAPDVDGQFTRNTDVRPAHNPPDRP